MQKKNRDYQREMYASTKIIRRKPNLYSYYFDNYDENIDETLRFLNEVKNFHLHLGLTLQVFNFLHGSYDGNKVFPIFEMLLKLNQRIASKYIIGILPAILNYTQFEKIVLLIALDNYIDWNMILNALDLDSDIQLQLFYRLIQKQEFLDVCLQNAQFLDILFMNTNTIFIINELHKKGLAIGDRLEMLLNHDQEIVIEILSRANSWNESLDVQIIDEYLKKNDLLIFS